MDKQTQLSPERQRLLALRLKGAARAPIVPDRIPRRPPGAPAPLSDGQHQMWVIDQMYPGNPGYNLPIAYRLRGELNIRALEDGFNLIIERHEAWRTTFREFEGDAVQDVHPECKIQICVIDLSHLPVEEREAQARTLTAEQAVKPFDLRQLPLVRVSLFRLEPNEHILLLNVHHIVSDGLSLNLMFDELDASYRAAISGTEPRLPQLPVQYADFAVWQKQDQQIARIAPQFDFWLRQLDGQLPVLEIATDMPRPPRQSFIGSSVDLSIPPPLVQALNSIATQHHTTFFVIVLAAYQVLLQRYAKADEVIIGTPVTNKSHPDVERLIGNFINVVALRCDLSGNPTFLELLQRSKETALNALSHKEVPFEVLVQKLNFHRDPSRNPVFQASLQVLPVVNTRIGDLAVIPFDFEQRSTQVDMALNLYEESGGGFSGFFQYCSELFSTGTIERFSRNLIQVLNEIVRDPNRRILDIPVLAEAERNQLLREWNQTGIEFPEEATVQALFERQARRTPDSIAVECESTRLTYRELDQRASRLAAHLQSLGAAPGALVGVCVERSVEMVVAVLGILKTGAAYVPLDPAFPAARLALMIEDAKMPLIVTQSALTSTLPPHQANVVCLDDAALAAAPAVASPATAGTLDDLAYVIFTSGSTGRPKGVEIPHRALTNFLCSMQRSPGMTASDVLLAVTTLSFDIAGLELFLPLITGARLVVIPRETAVDGWALCGELERRGATVLQATPATWRLLVESSWKGTPGLKALIGGEACPRELVAQLLPKCAELWNMYGPTETTIWSTIQKLTPEDAVITIGRPIANTQVYILDAQLQPAPIGVPGELHIGGTGLARGYLDRAPLTAEKFIRDPFSASPGVRIYKTGDLARYLPDGRIECLGRLDQQIKLRGFRIEPGEIEAVLKEQPSIRDAAVIMRTEGTNQHLVAYCVRRDAESAPHELPASLAEALGARLPAYMIPTTFVFLDALPLTANGKIDRRALPEPAADAKPTRAYAPPQNSVHQHLIEIWEEVLNRRPIGIRDDFFELGGHSLLAARVIALTTERLGHRLPFAEFFANPTIEAHTRSLFNSQVAIRQTPYAVINPEGKQTPVFFFHGDFVGGGFFCKTLASSIGSDRPFYALHPHGLQGDEVPLTIERMASDRLKQIREIQPKGPYHIGGYCNGALIAFHTARLLRESGEQVATLLMLTADGTNVRFGWLKRTMAVSGAIRGEDEAKTVQRFLRAHHRISDLEQIGTYYRRAASDLLKQPLREQFARFWRKAGRVLRRPLQANATALALKSAQVQPPNAGPIPQGPLSKPYSSACRAFIPRRYDGPMVLLWPKDEPPQSPRGPAGGWDKVCTHISVVEVPGHHHSCISLNANVAQVGHAMRKAIEQAESLPIST